MQATAHMNSFKKTGYHSFLGTNGSEQEGARAQCGSYRRISMYASRSRLEPVLDSARIYLSIYPRRPALRAVVWSCARTRIEGSCQRSPDRTLVAQGRSPQTTGKQVDTPAESSSDRGDRASAVVGTYSIYSTIRWSITTTSPSVRPSMDP